MEGNDCDAVGHSHHLEAELLSAIIYRTMDLLLVEIVLYEGDRHDSRKDRVQVESIEALDFLAAKGVQVTHVKWKIFLILGLVDIVASQLPHNNLIIDEADGVEGENQTEDVIDCTHPIYRLVRKDGDDCEPDNIELH